MRVVRSSSHFDPQISVTVTEDGAVQLSDPSGQRCSLRVACEGVPLVAHVHHGVTDPIAGWISCSHGKRTKTTTVVFSRRDKAVHLRTQIRFGD